MFYFLKLLKKKKIIIFFNLIKHLLLKLEKLIFKLTKKK